jgi:hypothetical protein
MSDLIITIVCPPLRYYKKQPEDQSQCELTDCPSCGDKMWLSEKKKEKIEHHTFLGDDILCECYICFTQRVKKDPSIMQEAKMSEI